MVQADVPPTSRNEKVGDLVKIFYGRFGIPKFDIPPPNEKLEIQKKNFMADLASKFDVPPQMKSWKSGEYFLWQIWHNQSLMYPPPPQNEKLEIWQKKFYGRFGMTKV